MKNLLLALALCLGLNVTVAAQPMLQKGGTSYSSFFDFQKTFPRVNEAWQKKEDTLQKQFAAKDLKWPAKYIYIRSFKYDSQLEVWVRNDIKEPFRLFKTYKICALAGTLGPKRMEGDYQVPEGFYYINEFNPRSTYYLSLGLNYPNASDKILSDSLMPGSDIYIHGSCVTVGCIPMTDKQIDEIYILAAHAKDLGQDFIPVHIFPIRYDVPKSVDYLNNLAKDDPSLKKFAGRLEGAFDYFEKYKQLPVILIDDNGDYVVNNAPAMKSVLIKEAPVKIKTPPQHRIRKVEDVANSVLQWPQFPGGADAFSHYLDTLGKGMVDFLPRGVSKAYVLVEFIVDKDGVPVNFQVVRGMKDEEFNEELITRMEKMPNWKPAILNNKPVAKKMMQTVTVEAR